MSTFQLSNIAVRLAEKTSNTGLRVPMLNKGRAVLALTSVRNEHVSLEMSNACNHGVVPSQNRESSNSVGHCLLHDNRVPVELHHAKNVIVDTSHLMRPKVLQSKSAGRHGTK